MKRTFTIKRNNQIIGILTSDNNFKYTKKSLALIYDIDKKILMLNTIDIVECNNNDTFSFSKNFIKISKEDEISDFLNNFKEAIKLMIPPCFLYKFNDNGTLNDEDGGIEDTFDYYSDAELTNTYIKFARHLVPGGNRSPTQLVEKYFMSPRLLYL